MDSARSCRKLARDCRGVWLIFAAFLQQGCVRVLIGVLLNNTEHTIYYQHSSGQVSSDEWVKLRRLGMGLLSDK